MIDVSFEKKVFPVVSPFDLTKYKKRSGSIVVVSPHPDDDVIGMGGNMRVLADQGLNVFSIYVTDGTSKIFKDQGNHKLSAVRQHEALNALRAVRAKAGIFLNYKSRNLTDSLIVKDIKDILDYFSPETVYLPSPFERHCTHLKVTELTVKAVRQLRNYSPELWGYSVWGGFFGGKEMLTVDISKVINFKKKAISMHKSQLKYKDYVSGMIGRNRYEGVFLETHLKNSFEYAETFVNMKELVSNRRLSLKGFMKRTGSFYPKNF